MRRYIIPELIPAPYFPLVRAVDATPALQTEHCAAVQIGDRSRIKAKYMVEIFFILQDLRMQIYNN